MRPVLRVLRSQRPVLGGMALVLMAPLWVACSKPEVAPEPVRSVKVITVGASSASVAPLYAGEVRARVESRQGFRVGGKLTERLVEVGQTVKAGQTLARLDPQDLSLGVQAVQAQVAAAQAQRDVAWSELKRYEALRQQNFISGAELERRESAFKTAEASWQQALAQAKVQANQLAYVQLQAPVAGVVTGIEAEVGQVVAAGQAVLRVAHAGPRDAVFAVPEQALPAFKLGQLLSAELTATGQVFKGQVREIAAMADPVTRTFAVRLALAQGEQVPLGASLTVQGPAPAPVSRPALMLPTTALRQAGQGSAVWVLDAASQSVRSVPVQTGVVVGNAVEITSGLSAGQQVVAVGVHVLAEGQKVTVYRGDAGPAGQRAAQAAAQPELAASQANGK